MKKIKNLIFMLFLNFFLAGNTLFVVASNDAIIDGGTLPEVVFTAERPKKSIFNPEDLKPKLPTDEEIKAQMAELMKKNPIKIPENPNECKGIKLNTDFPFIGRCIGISGGEAGVNQTNAFAYMIKGIMKFIITVILILSVLIIVVAGVMMTSGGYEKNNYSKGIEMIKNVARALALLGASGVILKLINPNFFT